MVVVVPGLVLLELFPGLVVEGLFDGKSAMPHVLVLFGDGAFFISDGLIALLFLGQQVLVFLLLEGVVFLLIGVDLAVAQDLVPWVLLLDGFDLPLVHMVEGRHLLFFEIDRHLCDLFLGRDQLVPFPLLTHLQDLHLPDMVVVVEIIFGSVYAFGLVFKEGHAAGNHFVVTILVPLSGLFSYLLHALY